MKKMVKKIEGEERRVIDASAETMVLNESSARGYGYCKGDT